MIEVPIFMHPLLDAKWKSIIDSYPESNPFHGTDRYTGYGVNAKALLTRVLTRLALGRRDEVAILTTSDSTYVSTCVSVTAFNHCKISRELSEETKLAIVIHEFGFLYPNFRRLIPELRKRGVFVIEDCAHLFVGENEDAPGTFGDCTLYSLPKIFPMQQGGMIRSDEKRFCVEGIDSSEPEKCGAIERVASEYLPKFPFFHDRRLENYRVLASVEGLDFYEPGEFCCPYFAGLESPFSRELASSLQGVEWGATLKRNLVYLPTNPLVEKSVFVKISDRVSSLYQERR